MAAMVLFGVLILAYIIKDFDKEPSSFCYVFAQDYQAIQYFRLDPPSTPKDLLLRRIKSLLAAGLPSMFGFAVFDSIKKTEMMGKFHFHILKRESSLAF